MFRNRSTPRPSPLKSRLLVQLTLLRTLPAPQARPQLAQAVLRHRRPRARAVVHWLSISPLASAWPLLLSWAPSSLEHPRILFASAFRLDFQACLQDLIHFSLGRVKAIVVISVSAYTIFIHVVGKLVFALSQMVSAFCLRTVLNLSARFLRNKMCKVICQRPCRRHCSLAIKPVCQRIMYAHCDPYSLRRNLPKYWIE